MARQIQQYAGRRHRVHPDKELVQIFDFADRNVSMHGAMLKKRIAGYREIGYSVRLGSTVTLSEPDAIRPEASLGKGTFSRLAFLRREPPSILNRAMTYDPSPNCENGAPDLA